MILYQLKKFKRHIFFTGYQTKCVTKLLFRPLMTSQLLRFIFSHPQAMTEGEGDDGKPEIQKIKYIKKKKNKKYKNKENIQKKRTF